MRKKILLFLFSVISLHVHAQIGIPQINNFSTLEYQGGTQNWGIDQDANGLMYFANNEGLLVYNGKQWKIYPLPHKTIVRSVKVAKDGKIYVGGQDELGYFFPNTNGVLKYFSLKELIPKEERELKDVWKIVINNQEIYFRTNAKILELKDGAFNIYKSLGSWEFIGQINNKIYAQDVSKGLMVLNNNAWELVADKSILGSFPVTSILPQNKDTLLVTTLKNGLFTLRNDKIERLPAIDNDAFITHRIYDAIAVNENEYAFATVSSGCFIVNKKGKIVQKFTYEEGLQKNNLRCVFQDRNKNLWLGLDDGIDFIAFSNAVKYIYPDKAKQLSSYASKVLDHTLYVGTSNGLFATSLNPQFKDLSYTSGTFKEIEGSRGQIWNLNVINKKLLVSYEDGALEVVGTKGKKLYQQRGTWMFEPLSTYLPSQEIVAGTYRGLLFLNYQNGVYTVKSQQTKIDESLRFIVYDFNNNAVWASHPYRGIYRFKLSEDKKGVEKAQLFTSDNGLPSALGNYVARIQNRIVIATVKGIYEFYEGSGVFQPSKRFSKIFGEMRMQYLKEDDHGNIWFVSNKKVGVVSFNNKGNKGFDVIYFPELNSQLVAGFENIYVHDQENVFIGANKGLIHINYLNYIKNIKPINVNITLVKATGEKDSLLFGGYFLSNGKLSETQDETALIKLPNRYNSLHFEYSSTLYEQQNNIEFSYKLSGFDNEWSQWSSKSEKDYTNLPSGDYSFQVRSRNNLGNESSIVHYRFVVEPAWYQTWLFYFACFLLLGLLVILIVQRQKRKYLKEQNYLKKTHQLEIEHNEKEIVKLRNERLEADVNFKNQELATATMHLMQRGKLISRIKEELLPIVKTENIDDSPEEFKKILSLIKDAERADSDWEHFSVHFDHVHANFLSKLKEKAPVLSANDLKLCAYLKMNLTSKEIAQLMSVTVRAVEVSRYRLRKKLDVSSETNLFDYLIELTSG